ncbi:MAG: serine protease [Acidimicrobiales bacterium]
MRTDTATETTTHTKTRTATHQKASGQRRSRPMAWVALLLAITVLAGACGTGDTTTESGGDTTGGLGSGGVGDDSGLVSQCPERSTMFDLMNRATYEVFGEFLVDDADEPRYIPIGTAWGLDDRVLVTNGHVADAYESIASSGLQLNRAVGVQAGTGEVIELLRAIVHPDYTGDPLSSPDVALFTTKETLPTVLTLASDSVDISVGDELLLAGFPGDVDTFLRPVPGLTVPQATSLTGEVTALRSHDPTEVVTMENLDVIQHQAPTSPGTSGSAIVSCDPVVAINNAGTVRLVFTPGDDGETTIDRQPAAANNFGVHVRHIRNLMELFESNALQGYALPVEAEGPSGGGVGEMAGGDAPAEAVTLVGAVSDQTAAHDFVITINPDGSITGTSTWDATGDFVFTGQLNADGTVFFTDDAPEQLGYRRGTYEGTITSETTIEGIYYEQGQEDSTWAFAALVS